jgi:kynurenine--oxoglutarate transaminase/cysteine-S-conjugate beta-lyase/glutamine--phenylpyruvate transaminase/kynurenine aminotransferase
VIVLEDNVYEGIIFDDMFKKPLPKISQIKNFRDRTLSIYSAGKIFAATGVRSGWVIGPSNLIKAVRSSHQYNVFCAYNVIENTIAKSLDHISRPNDNYLPDTALKLTRHRNLIIQELLKAKFDFDLWVPKGGYFVIVDISKVQVNPKYLIDEEGKPRTKDFAFAFQLAYENGVVCIPCSPFYGQ